METLIETFIFNDYPKEIQLSKAQRVKHFEWNGTTIKSKSKKLWKKCIKDIYKNEKNIKPSYLKNPYVVIGIKGDKMVSIFGDYNPNNIIYSLKQKNVETILSDVKLNATEKRKKLKHVVYNTLTKEIICANPTQVGKPKMHRIKGQDFYVGLNEYIRVKIVDFLKDYFYNKIKEKKVFKINNFPIKLKLTIFDTLDNTAATKTVEGSKWDVGNKALPYLKVFSDFISNNYKDFEKIIPDDEKSYIYAEESCFIPITKEETPTLLFELIYNDEIANQYKEIIEWRKNQLLPKEKKINTKQQKLNLKF